MDISKAVRDAGKVHATLMDVGDQLVTKTGCDIYIPENYTDKGLATIGSEVSTLGVFAHFIDDTHYVVSKATSMMNLGPCTIDNVMMGDRYFLKLSFEPGSVVIDDTNLIVDKKLTNFIMDYYIDYGHAPWYMTYRDLAELFINSEYFNHMNMGINQAIQDVIVAGISRSPDDVNTYFRHVLKSARDLARHPRFVPLRDIAINTTSNLARMNGSELGRGVKAMLLSQPDHVEPLEELMIGE